MIMNNVLTLPPGVYGKVEGLLKLYVKEIHISKGNFHLNNESCIVAEVQWWGETVSVFLSPEKVCLCNQNGDLQVINSYQRPATYVINTNSNLFRTYLENCEILEIVVFDMCKKFVIGSSFLSNLLCIVKNYNKTFVLPLVDFQGDVTGSLKINFKLINNLLDEENCNQQIIPQDKIECNSVKQSFYDEVAKTTSYSDHARKTIPQTSKTMPKMPAKLMNESDKKCSIFNLNKTYFMDPQIKNKPVVLRRRKIFFPSKSSSNKIEPNNTEQVFPQIESTKDFSKVISVNLNKTKHSEPQNVQNKKQFAEREKKITVSKTPFYVPKVIPSPSNLQHNIPHKNNTKSIEVQEKHFTPAKEVKHNKLVKNKVWDKMKNQGFNCTNRDWPECVINYLLGFDMGKEDEEKALSSLVAMSPCHHCVKNITKLHSSLPCASTSFFESHHTSPTNLNVLSKTFKGDINLENSDSRIFKNLEYKMNNPVERQYYNKFFLNNENSHGCVILNKAEQDWDKQINHIHESDFNWKMEKGSSDGFSIQGIMFEAKNKKERLNNRKWKYWDEYELEENCCQYYTKLNELDKIIDSLNNYEKKILSDEKLFSL